ncbi:MAG: Nif3-like dinuclear metal center hexameric protein [Bacteroidota bacterium]
MRLSEIIRVLEQHAPLSLQESYDNSGLQVGDPKMDINGALITTDVTPEVLDEAIRLGFNLIISHHPLIFGGIKSLTGRTVTEQLVIHAIRNEIAIYSGHTNFDAVFNGVSLKICDKLGLINNQILEPVKGSLKKLVVFVPLSHAGEVREALFRGGAGVIGNYDSCSFNLEGTGTFRGGENTDPFVGEKGKLHREAEVRIETVIPAHLAGSAVEAMKLVHPYEEVAYDLYPLENDYPLAGMGMLGELPDEMDELMFLQFLKDRFSAGCIRHTALLGKKVRKVAVCGGAGSFLLKKAIAARADVFITGDMKYHGFFDAVGRILLADIGHYESEQFTQELFYELIIKNFPKFAVRLSEINTNPIKYF